MVFAAAVSAGVKKRGDAAIVIGGVIGSALLDFLQEYAASSAMAKLRTQIHNRAIVLRDGQQRAIRRQLPCPAA